MSKLDFYTRTLSSQARMQKRVFLMVENEEDSIFWTDIFAKYAPHLKVKCKVPREHGSGKTILQEIQKRITNPSILFCYDSDSDYFLKKEHLNDKYAFQTYAYSVENLRCIPQNLNRICQIATFSDNLSFDFEVFITNFSKTLYPVVLYVLSEKDGEYEFLKSDFKALENWDLTENGQKVIEKYQEILKNITPENTGLEIKRDENQIQVTPETAYLFFQGHILENIICGILKWFVKQTRHLETRTKKEKKERNEYLNKIEKYDISTLYYMNYTNLLTNENCFLTKNIESDIKSYLAELPENLLKYFSK